MAFDSLSSKLQDVFKQLKGKGKLTEKDVKSAMKEIKIALLDADVNFKIVKDFIKTVTEKSIGDEVMQSLTPGQHVVKIVNEELTTLMGGVESKLTFSTKSPTVYMMVGLQGAGKTTTTGKLANKLKKEGRRPLLAACDIYRPAAIKQLEVLGNSLNIPIFQMGTANPVDIAKSAIDEAISKGNDIVILDTAGRLHIDETLMDELKNIKSAICPQEILLVIDAMTGQDSVNVATAFNEALGIDGVIVTKLDGDTRGGVALSVKAVTGKPIKFAATGEKLDDLEAFHPDRMASRILGMGDVLSLIDKVQQNIDEEEASKLNEKLKNQEFDFEDFLSQMQQMKKMGPLKDLLGMIPGLPGNINLEENVDEKSLAHIEAIIQSMTKEERKNPDLINGSRKKRIAMGSGNDIQDINKLLKQFKNMKKMMKQFGNFGGKQKKGLFGNMPFLR
ncbi:MAG: signal recognition particle protein [Lachnospirales bacterium]